MKNTKAPTQTTSRTKQGFLWVLLLILALVSSVSLLACGLTDHVHQPINRKQDCTTCHIDSYDELKSHTTSALSKDCSSCHTKDKWNPSTIHAGMTLVGKHRKDIACASCHKEKSYTDVSKITKVKQFCYGCHQDDYEKTKEPKHTFPAYPYTCENCHKSQDAWKPAGFADHDKFFPLLGKHKVAPCTKCHVNDVYKGTPKDCLSCHKKDFDNAANPKHTPQKNPPKACNVCHNETGWKPADYKGHDKFYPLIGKHKTTDCVNCHQNDKFAGTPKDCKSCHQKDYDNATNPKHDPTAQPAAGCAGCHTPVAWKPGNRSFHNKFYKLDGKHTNVACVKCHTNNNYDNTPEDCIGCHKKDYDATTNPKHTASAYPTNACKSCHTTKGWKPADPKFHDKFFALKGKHIGVKCESCHVNGKYKGTPKDCYSCHTNDYKTAKPPHSDGAFPKGSCISCHSENGWKPSKFDHEKIFPLKTGEHTQLQNDCKACHIDPKNYKNFTCMSGGCHTKNDMDNDHLDEGVAGYVYNAKNCYKCHPKGKAD